MNRREFFKKSIQAGVVTGAAVTFPGFVSQLFARKSYAVTSEYDLVAVRGGEAEKMFDEAIKTFGGMNKFVKKNQTVVVKPNIGWDVPPERAANTNPNLVKRIVEHCFEAGAKDVYVFDNTCDDWRRAYSNSGIEKAAKDAGARVVPAHTESNYQSVNIKNAKRLQQAKVHELILSTDVFINVPILKHHSSTKLTIAMKNLMGVVWDRRYWHRNDLNQCIADYTMYRKPDLNVVDAYRVLKQNGPRGVSLADVVLMKSLIVTQDIVAADAASSRLLEFQPDAIPHIDIAGKMNIGNPDLNSLNIKRIMLQ